MKFKYLFLALLLGYFLLVLPKFQTVYAVGCLTRKVTFITDSWSGGTITVKCYGDNPVGPNNCGGNTVTLSPGESKSMNNCSCSTPPGNAADGCLHITSKPPPGCKVVILGGDHSSCGENGQHLPSTLFGDCQALTPTPTRKPTPTPTRKPTPTPTRAPTSSPTRTPTPTPIGAPTSGPTRTPTPTPIGAPTSGPTRTPTPTQEFSPDMCKCDGMDATTIFPGANVSFSAFAKVFGTDINLAKVKDITFSVFESQQDDPNKATLHKKSSPISSQIISQDSSAVRYKSSWNYVFPSNVNTTSLYRVIAQINCVKKIAMAPQNVLAATTQPSWIQNLFNNIFKRPFDLIAGFFGGGPEQLSEVASQTPTQTASQRNTLQLKTLRPAKMLEKSCSLIKFQFNNQ